MPTWALWKRWGGIQKLFDEDPKAAETLKSFNHTETCRPRIELDQPDIFYAIINIIRASSATNNRRYNELLQTVTTLDNLHSELKKVEYKLSKSVTYLLLLPRRGNTQEGKQYLKTVPVKLLRLDNNLQKRIRIECLQKASSMTFLSPKKMFGSEAVTFLSNNDKARIPLGLAAAIRAPILVHLECKVMLPYQIIHLL